MLRLKKFKNKIFCTITINSSDVLMMLDTGSNMSYISDSLAKNCKVVGRAKTAGHRKSE